MIIDIAYVRYQAPDLDKMEQFLSDFGLQRAKRTDDALYMRAHGPAHHVHITQKGDASKALGFGFIARSGDDLRVLARRLNKEVRHNPEPGGGLIVQFTDPAGFLVDVIHGQERLARLPHREPIEANTATTRRRRGNPIRLEKKPSSVLRLGHVAIAVPDYQQAFDFYHDVLGLRTSDSYFAGPDNATVASFMHCDLGSDYTDHHTIAIIGAMDGKARMDHSAFEVIDLDDVVQGGEYLKAKGYVHSWGVGRHIQGSQIFDYWRDPFGNKIEHWTDGDLVNKDSPVTRAQLTPDALAQWAPEFSPDFFS